MCLCRSEYEYAAKAAGQRKLAGLGLAAAAGSPPSDPAPQQTADLTRRKREFNTPAFKQSESSR